MEGEAGGEEVEAVPEMLQQRLSLLLGTLLTHPALQKTLGGRGAEHQSGLQATGEQMH